METKDCTHERDSAGVNATEKWSPDVKEETRILKNPKGVGKVADTFREGR